MLGIANPSDIVPVAQGKERKIPIAPCLYGVYPAHEVRPSLHSVLTRIYLHQKTMVSKGLEEVPKETAISSCPAGPVFHIL